MAIAIPIPRGHRGNSHVRGEDRGGDVLIALENVLWKAGWSWPFGRLRAQLIAIGIGIGIGIVWLRGAE